MGLVLRAVRVGCPRDARASDSQAAREPSALKVIEARRIGVCRPKKSEAKSMASLLMFTAL
jgi:hypothetical protein